jgi:hypothetical protein
VGKKSRSVARALQPEPPKPSWNQRDARIVHGIDLAFRGLAGLVAALLGGLIATGLMTFPQARLDADGPLATVIGTYPGAWLGAGLLAFAGGQLLQLFFVGGDQYYDQRLWETMSPAERGAWRMRERDAGRRTWRLFILLAIAATVVVDLRVARVPWRGEGAMAALLLAVGANLAVAALAVFGWALRGRTQDAPAVPVSDGRWAIETRDDPRVGPWIGLLFGTLMAASYGMDAARGRPADRMVEIVLCAAGVAIVLGSAGQWFRVRQRARPRRRLEITRKTDVPLYLECKAALPLSPRELRARTWLARLAAYETRVMLRTDETWQRWLDLTATVHVEPATGKLVFGFALPPLRDLPSQALAWRLQLEHPPSPRPLFEFDLPPEVVFPEEFAAS